ncbi:MAG: S-layer homology domain-containing protein [Clostridiaceae bacterium]|nr:S-layer homology domain-containing protein [Clostridiaceae bacterium]
MSLLPALTLPASAEDDVTTSFSGTLTTANSFHRPSFSDRGEYVGTDVLVGPEVDHTYGADKGAVYLAEDKPYNYFTVNFTPAVAGAYAFTVTSASLTPRASSYGYAPGVGAADDTSMFIYLASKFDPEGTIITTEGADGYTKADNGPLRGLMYAQDDIVLSSGYNASNNFKSRIATGDPTKAPSPYNTVGEFLAGTTYTLVLTSYQSGVTGTINVEITGPGSVAISTNNYTSGYAEYSPANNATGVAASVTPTLTFAKEIYSNATKTAMDASPTGVIKVYKGTSNTGTALEEGSNFTVAYDSTNHKFTVTFGASLGNSQAYYVELQANKVYDAEGNAITSAQGATFTTADVPTAAYTAEASAVSGTPAAGASDTIALTVKDSLGNTDTTFSGSKTVTVSGYQADSNGNYGSFGGTALTGTSTAVNVTFSSGVATADLTLNKADAQTIGFSISGVNTASANSLSITPTAGAVSSMAVTQDITAPASNGGAFAQQPKITLKDTYGNVCTNDSATQVTVSKNDGGSWTLTGTAKTATAASGVATFSGIGATNDTAVTGAQLKFSVTGLTDVTSTAVTLPAPSPSGGGSSTSGSSSNNGAVVIVNGETKTAGTAQTTTSSSGQTTTTVTVDTSKLENILASQGTGATVTIPITGNSDVAAGTLTGAMVKSMETKDATLVVQTDSGTYTIPASEINIEAVSQQLGTSVSLSDIKVTVSISEPSASMTKIIESAAQDGGFTIMVPAVDYIITCTHGSQTVDVSSFNAYVERTIAIPDGVDPTKITTGVVVEPDGTTHHVPTRVTVMNGKYYAVINSLTNSTYSIVWNPIEFSDVSNHWAKDAINNMGSRMVVTGIGNNNYAPDRNMTRAEFATIMIRALGLEPGTGASGFGDVAVTDWCSGYIKTAASYGIIKGYDNGNFGPNDMITREQAMTMITRAMMITKLSAGLTDSETNQLLSTFSDGESASDYAKESIASCLKTGIISGTSETTISPKANITRAEVAVMVERLLQKSNLI